MPTTSAAFIRAGASSSGWDAVRQSWDAIFEGSREMRFSIGDVRPHVDADLGWVTCTENILSHARGQVAVTSLLATNVFERRRGEWLMIHHHASHILAGRRARARNDACWRRDASGSARSRPSMPRRTPHSTPTPTSRGTCRAAPSGAKRSRRAPRGHSPISPRTGRSAAGACGQSWTRRPTQLIGQCGLNHLPDGSDVELLYALSRASWGRGLATEAGRAALDHGFGPVGSRAHRGGDAARASGLAAGDGAARHDLRG